LPFSLYRQRPDTTLQRTAGPCVQLLPDSGTTQQ
jgi:hypothetical protein